MKTRYFLLAVALTLLLVFGYGVMPTMRTSTAAPAPADDAPSKGKVLIVTMDSKYSYPLEHVQVRKMGDRSFLVGKGVKLNQQGNYTEGRIVWLPMCHVECITEFGSVEEVKKAQEESQKNMPVVPAPQVEVDKPPPARQPQ